jgi:PAS domain-containing protein
MNTVGSRDRGILMLSKEVVQSVMFDKNIAALIDNELKYSLINQACCKQLNRSSESLIGKCILDLYPEITASQNHRNILRALEGNTINEVVEGMNGSYFRSVYQPVSFLGKITHVLVKASQVNPGQ